MNLADESGEIIAIRVDQNRNAFFKCHIGQRWDAYGCVVHAIEQDYDELSLYGRIVISVVMKSDDDLIFEWQRFVNPTNLQLTFKQPNISEQEMLLKILSDESFWDKSDIKEV